MTNTNTENNQEVIKRLNKALKLIFNRRGIMLKSEMAQELGYKGPYFSGVTTGKEKLSMSFLATLNTTLGINPEWVLTGKGPMTLKDKPKETETQKNLVPLVPVSAHGGSLSLFSQRVNKHDCELIASPIEGIDLAITVTGESMAPEYPNGAIVMVKKIDDKAFIEWGKTYVLDTRNGLVIKVLAPGKKESSIKCISINKDPVYAPFEVSREDIFGIYMVKICMARK